LNSEDLSTWRLELDPLSTTLRGQKEEIEFYITPQELRSVYFRRPVYLREYGVPFPTDAQHERIQWASFYRNLMVFDHCLWVNCPASTYVAEHKAVQLQKAQQVGFEVPWSRVVNHLHDGILDLENDQVVAVKGLDTVLVRSATEELFGYTSLMPMSDLTGESLQQAPFILQQALDAKIDIRVTVVAEEIFAVAILKNGKPVHGDWRREKNTLSYKPITLPVEIQTKCRRLTKRLGLTFAAIDLALCDGKYFFLEVNPTGEWAWLVDCAHLPIDVSLASCLARG
jgi:glutathione synthase/RimK-type ligase-like ATP-grasp enzyme